MIVCDYRHALAEQLAEINQNMVKIFLPFLTAEKITPLQAGLLFILRNENPMTIGELSRAASMACGNLSPLIKKMAAQELVKKRRRVCDERIVEISLAEKGTALLESIEKEMEACFCSVFKEYTREQLNSFLEVLTELNHFLNSLLQAAENRQAAEESQKAHLEKEGIL